MWFSSIYFLFIKRLQKPKRQREVPVQDESEEERGEEEESEREQGGEEESEKEQGEEEESEEETEPRRIKVRLSRVCDFHIRIFCLLNIYSLTPTLPHRAMKSSTLQTKSMLRW